LSYIDLKKFLVKGFRQQLNKVNLVEYLGEILALTVVIQKVNCNLLVIPFTLVRKLNRYSSSSFFTNTIEKDISYTRKGESFLDETVVNYKIQTKIITKHQGYYVIIVIAKLVHTDAYRFSLYFPQLKRNFEFVLYGPDLFSAEVGLHKQAINKGSAFNQSIGFRRASQIIAEKETSARPVNKGKRPSTLISAALKKGNNSFIKAANEKASRKRSDNSGLSGISRNTSKTHTQRTEKPNLAISMVHRQPETGRNKSREPRFELNKRLLSGLEEITPKSVLEDYFRYEQKAYEIIRFEVLSHRQVNLKHTRECIETFSNPLSLLIPSRWRNFVKFYSAFYWRCMIQMMTINIENRSLRVTLSKFNDRLKECIESRIVNIQNLLFKIGFYVHNDKPFKLSQLKVEQGSKVEVIIENQSQNYQKIDVITFGALIKAIKGKKYYPYSRPTPGNLKIACAVGCRNISKNLEYLQVSRPENLLFIEKNMRLLLCPTMEETDHRLSIMGLTKSTSFSDSTKKIKLQSAFEGSSMNLSERLLNSLQLDPRRTDLILLVKKIFLRSPLVMKWILLNKSAGSILFVFYFAETGAVRKRSASLEVFSESLPYLQELLETCCFFEAGLRIHATMQNEFIRLFHLGTLFEL
jgi:hypothetical protein